MIWLSRFSGEVVGGAGSSSPNVDLLPCVLAEEAAAVAVASALMLAKLACSERNIADGIWRSRLGFGKGYRF